MVELMEKIRVGLIGCGRISVMHLTSIALLEETELIACCDIKKERADDKDRSVQSKDRLARNT